MKLLPPLPPPRLLPSKEDAPRPRPPARTPLELARSAWRPEPNFPAPSQPSGQSVFRWRDVPTSRLVIGGLTVAIVGAIIALFLLESRWGYSGRSVPVVFFQSWPATRTAADAVADQQAAIAAAHQAAAESRAYIATLHGEAKVKAQNQYNAYIAAQPKPFQPEGFVAPAPAAAKK